MIRKYSYIKRLLFSKKEHIRKLVAVIICIITYTLCNLIPPAVLGNLVDELTLGKVELKFIRNASILLIISYGGKALFRIISDYLAHQVAWNIVADVRIKAYGHLQQMSQKFFSNKQTGQIMSRIVGDTNHLELFIAHAIPDMVSNIVIFIGVFSMMMSINIRLALIACVPLPIIIIATKYTLKQITPTYATMHNTIGEMNTVLHDNVQGMKEIQIFGKEEYELNHFSRVIYKWRDSMIRVSKITSVFPSVIEIFVSLGSVLVVGIGGVLVTKNMLNLGDIVKFLLYIGVFYTPISALVRSVDNISQSITAIERICEILDLEVDIKNCEDAVVLMASKGEIEFKNVSFRYEGSYNVLKNINLKIPAFKTTAVAGFTGSGKTTLTSLIARFYDTTEGGIYIDGHNIKNLTKESLRSQISMVLQDTFLFNGTIEENIAYGIPICSKAQIIEAAKVACIHDYIESIPEGYNTIVGERGIKLSGGQKQRLSIARAVLRKTPILILDEATASIDTSIEKEIKKAINNLRGKCTMIIIAHRLSTIKNADKIIVLDQGEIKEEGTHEILIKQDGIYAKFCMQ